MSTYAGTECVAQALEAGADGHVLKAERVERIVWAIQSVYQGHRYFSEESSARRTIRVLLIEPDQRRRQSMHAAFSSEPDMRVLEAENIQTALGVLSAHTTERQAGIPPDSAPEPPVNVVVINMDAIPDMKAWARMRASLWDTHIVGLTDGSSELTLMGALAYRVAALQRLDAKPGLIIQTVRSVDQGETQFDLELTERLRVVLERKSEDAEAPCWRAGINAAIRRLLHGSVHLTSREEQVLTLLGEAKSNRQIALELQISEKTVEFHVGNVLKKLGLVSRIEAALLAFWMKQR